MLLFASIVFGQGKKISGQVKDEKGDPIPFASIKIQGTSRGTSADANGMFTLDITDVTNPVLVVSSQGFAQKTYPVGTSTFIEAGLNSTGQLKEVVITTALGIQRSKNKLPYAAQVVNGEDLNRSRSSNFIGNLSGRVAGLDIKQANNIGGSVNVVLRGNKSISGSNQALFVVDGVPFDNTAVATTNQRAGRGGFDYGNAAADINPDDIESVTVLKGPAASALYGSRGFNGVILITTKKAKKGLGITVNTGITSLSVDKATFPKHQQLYGGGYGPYYEDPSGYFLYRNHNNWADVSGNGPDLVVPTFEDASYGGAFDATKMVYQWDAFDPSSPNYGKARPWLPAAHEAFEFMQHPINFNNSIFIDGGSEKGTFKLGYTRNDDKGILPNSKMSKDQFVFAGSLNLTSRLTASAVVNYIKTKGLGRYATGYSDPGNPFGSFRQWWQVNVDILEQKDAYFRTGKNVTWNWADPSDPVPIYWDNLWFNRYENYEQDGRNRYFGNAMLNYKITDWLNVMGRISMDQYDEIQEERAAVGSLDVPFYSRNNRNRNETNYDLLVTFDKNITEDISLKALLGGNVRTEKLSTVFASTNGGLVVPKLYALSNSKNPINPPTENLARREVNGIFGGITLGYKDFVTLDATLRRDVSSTLPKDNNAYYYPSVSGGFIFSNLLKSVDWLSYGKLRGNYAEVGNDAPVYSLDNTFQSVASFGSTNLFAVPTTAANNKLVPEKNKSYEIGLEMAFLKSRVGFDLTFYNARSFNQILPVSVSRATGFNAKFVNSGEVENKGVELTVYGTPVKTRDFSWTINVNWSRNRNKVIDLFDDGAGNKIDNIVLGNITYQGGVTLNATLGQPYGVIKGIDFTYYGDSKNEKRDPATRIVGANGRYVLTSSANYTIGDPNPDWMGGVSNTLKYKDLSLSFLIEARQGGDIFSLDMYYGLGTGIYPETAGLNDLGKPVRNTIANGGGFIRPGVTAAGAPNTVRVAGNNYTAYGWVYNPPAMFIYDASFVKLREVALGYSLPASIIDKIRPFKGIDVSLVGRNLWIIHKNLPYSDPEESYGSGNNANGYQGNAYPATRTISFNIKMRF